MPIVAPLRAVRRPRHPAAQALSIPTPQPRTARPFPYSPRRSIMKRRTLSGEGHRDRPPALALPFGRSRSPGPPVAAGESRGHRAIAIRALRVGRKGRRALTDSARATHPCAQAGDTRSEAALPRRSSAHSYRALGFRAGIRRSSPTVTRNVRAGTGAIFDVPTPSGAFVIRQVCPRTEDESFIASTWPPTSAWIISW